MDLKIDVEQVLRSKLKDKATRVPSFVVSYFKRIIHQDELNGILERYKDVQGVDFMSSIIDDFNVKLNVEGGQNFPSADNRYIFASNHPLGGLDGICLTSLIGHRYGKKVLCLVNDLLLAIPNLRSVFIPINKHGSQSKQAAQKMEQAFQSDNQIITFPAGLCSRRQKGRIIDGEWKKSFIQKAVKYERDVVPIYFEGQNSNFFYRLAKIRQLFCIKMNIEMLYLPDEMFKKRNSTFRVHIGEPISWRKFDMGGKAGDWAQWTKNVVYQLGKK